MADEITIEKLHALAKAAGLNLPDDELQRLLPGVNRSKKQVAELRQFVGAEDEPAATFNLSKVNQK